MRDRNVYVVGAGLSCALGLPNTAMLLDGVLELSNRVARWQRDRLAEHLEKAFEFFYPDAVHEGYKPDVVDFFSALRTWIDVGAGFPGGFSDAPQLYRSLKLAIAQMLIEKTKACGTRLRAGHDDLDEIVRPGNIVVTSNWDLLLERYASLHGIPVRLSEGGPDELTLLKLHGSIDWCLGEHLRRPANTSNYAVLNELLFGVRPYRPAIPAKTARRGVAVRTRSLESWGSAWRTTSGGAREPLMVTMARGKVGDLGPLRGVWRDAYGAVSRARRLEIVGYSMPPDDIEIRTLLRAGVQRGSGLDEVMVRNPAPEVHLRVRQYLDRGVASDYRGVSPS